VNKWRCCLCGHQCGVVIRCAAIACTIRAHPHCVTLAGSKWLLCSFKQAPIQAAVTTVAAAGDEATAGEAKASTVASAAAESQSDHTSLGFLCVAHSNSFLVA